VVDIITGGLLPARQLLITHETVVGSACGMWERNNFGFVEQSEFRVKRAGGGTRVRRTCSAMLPGAKVSWGAMCAHVFQMMVLEDSNFDRTAWFKLWKKCDD
jgi:hypothetical protein